jgi:hypothetical protein
MFWFSLQLLSRTFLILRRNGWEVIINVKRSSCKIPVMSDLNGTWNLTDAQIPNFTKIHPLGAKLFHADRQTKEQTWQT